MEMATSPMVLPTLRLPECSITHTRSASSRHSSMKWLPPPSVPHCFHTRSWSNFFRRSMMASDW